MLHTDQNRSTASGYPPPRRQPVEILVEPLPQQLGHGQHEAPPHGDLDRNRADPEHSSPRSSPHVGGDAMDDFHLDAELDECQGERIAIRLTTRLLTGGAPESLTLATLTRLRRASCGCGTHPPRTRARVVLRGS